MRNADQIIREAQASTARLACREDRLAVEAGIYAGELKSVWRELNPPADYSVERFGITFNVDATFEYDEDERGEYVNIIEIRVYLRGVEVNEMFSRDDMQSIEWEVVEQFKSARDDDAEADAVQAHIEAVA